MTRYLLCLLACLAWAHIACCLECYVCPTPTAGDKCLTAKNCSQDQNWCFSTIYGPTTSDFPFSGPRTVVRNCAEKCQDSNPSFWWMSRTTLCCQEHRCNTASGTGEITASSWSYLSLPWTIVLAIR